MRVQDRGKPRSIGVILLQLGGPERLEAVAPFLKNLFSDPDIIPVPGGPAVQKPLAWLISTVRAPRVRRLYAEIGGGSPLRCWTEVQARNLETELARRAEARSGPHAPSFRVTVAMRYWHPFTEEALAAVSGAEALLAVSLFPHYSIATTGSSLKELARLRAQNGDERSLAVIEHWYAAPAYLAALATRVRAAVARLTPEGRAGALILWSAHGLPQKIIDRGDPYVTHIERTIAGTMVLLEDLGLPHRLAYQSRTGPIKWIGPGTENVIREEAAHGRRALVVVPVSFVSDHIETLYEIDLLYGRKARHLGIQEVVRMDSFNEGADLTGVLAGLVEERLGRDGWLDTGLDMEGR